MRFEKSVVGGANTARFDITIVIPVYGSPKTLRSLFDQATKACRDISKSCDFVFVDDRCPYGSWKELELLAYENENVTAVRLSRNYGQHAAIGCGLGLSRGDWVVVMDCDLQDRPEEIKNLYEAALTGYDVVRAKRRDRTDSLARRVSSYAFYKMLSFLSDTSFPNEVANFGIYSRKVINAVTSWEEDLKYFPAIVSWVGFKETNIWVKHGERKHSKSGYNFSKLLKLATNVIVGFSDKPLRLSMFLGLLLAVGSFICSLFILFLNLTGRITIEGWTTIMLSLWFLAGTILFGLGIVGLYVGRILSECKQRPAYIVDHIIQNSRKLDS